MLRLIPNPWAILGAIGAMVVIGFFAYLRGANDKENEYTAEQLGVSQEQLRQIQEANDAAESFLACTAVDGYGVSIFYDPAEQQCYADTRSDRRVDPRSSGSN